MPKLQRQNVIQFALMPALLGASLTSSACSSVNVWLGKKSKKSAAPSQTETASSKVTYFDHIAPILSEHCLACHGASSPILKLHDYPASRAQADRVVSAVVTRRMPQWLAAPGHEEYQDDPSLTSEEIALFGEWKKGGYQEGDVKPSPTTQGDHHQKAFTPTVTLPSMGVVESYEPVFDRENEYRCFTVQIPSPWTDKSSFINAVQLNPGHLELVHHLTLFMVSPDIAKALKTVDEFDPRPGYACGGDSLPSKLSDEALRTRLEQEQPGILQRFPRESSWVYHWAPGMHGTTLPQGTGIRLNPGTVLVMQYHFHALAHKNGHGLHDMSREEGGTIALRLVDQVEKPAFVQTLSRDDWYDSRRNGSLVVPPKRDTTVQALYPIKGLFPLIQEKTGLGPLTHIEIHSANLHMHTRGVQAETWLEQRSGERDTMLAITAYSYNAQRDYFFKNPKMIHRDAAEDVAMGIRCTYFNPGNETVYGGLYSEDEMCINFFYVAAAGTPK